LAIVAFEKVRSMADAEDIVEDVFRKVLARGPGPEIDYRHLRTAVVNAALNHLRNRNARASVAEGWGREAASSPPDPFGVHDPEREIRRRGVSLAVHRALAELPEEQAGAVCLVDLEGYGLKDAAAILEITEGALRKRLTRGRGNLAAILAARGVRSADDVWTC
jgi:RNA polymerase sigma-70 factor (ECF subfamily)